MQDRDASHRFARTFRARSRLSLWSDDRLRVSVGEITIAAIDVAERGRLDDQQFYSGHEAPRPFAPLNFPLTNYATNCSMADPDPNSGADATPSCPTDFPRRAGDFRQRAAPRSRVCQVSGETDQVYRDLSREEAIAAAEAQARERAIAALP